MARQKEPIYPQWPEREPSMKWKKINEKSFGSPPAMARVLRWNVQDDLHPAEFDEERRWLWRYILWLGSSDDHTNPAPAGGYL